MKRLRAATFLLFLSVLFSSYAFVAISALTIAERSTIVVAGEVKGIRSKIENGIIYSYVVFFVAYVRSGPSSLQNTEITIKHVGGAINGTVLWQSDQPYFFIGEKAQLSIEAEDQVFRVVGGYRGKTQVDQTLQPVSQRTAAGYKLSWFRPPSEMQDSTTRPGLDWYGPLRWADASLPITYWIDTRNIPSGVSETTFITHVRQSYQNWEDDPASYIDYTYGGIRTDREPGQNDGVNIFCWRYIDGPRGTLGITLFWSSYTLGNYDSLRITDSDIKLDTGDSWSAADTCPLDRLDVQNIATHEAGHTALLADLKDPEDSDMTMYGAAPLGETKKRTLAWGDQAGIRALYPTGIQYNIGLESREDDGASSNKGLINSYSLPTTTLKTAGAYSVTYYPEGGYWFVRWETSGGISVSDAGSQSTTVTVSSSGTLRAIYANLFSPLTVALISPSNGAMISSSPVELKVRVSSSGGVPQEATVKFYVDSSYVGSRNSDANGYASYNYNPSSVKSYSWYVTAEKYQYDPGTSPTWTFTYGQIGVLQHFDLDYYGSPPSSDGNDQESITANLGATFTLFFYYKEGNVGNYYIIRVFPEWDKANFIARSDKGGEVIENTGRELGGSRWGRGSYTVPSTGGTYKVRVVYSATSNPPTWYSYDRLLAEGTITVNQKPWASIVSPSGWLRGTVTLTATAGDPDGYVVRVRFYWTPDRTSIPLVIGDDINGADGWSISWDCGGPSNNDASVWVAAVALDNLGFESDWSWSNQFGVDHSPPGTPSLSSPAHGSYTSSTRPTFLWNSAGDWGSGTAFYVFQIDTSTSFSSGNLRTITGIISMGYTPDAPLMEGTWYWRVKQVDNVGNEGSFSSYWSIIVDTTPPVGSIAILGGATYATSTSVTLTLSASDINGVAQMRFSNDGSSWSSWYAYSTSTSWNLLSGDGTKTVYVQFKDNAGLVSSSYSDTVILDTSPPAGSISINGGAAYARSTSVSLTLTYMDATSGVSQVRYSNDGVWDTEPWESPSGTKSWTLTVGDGAKTVYYQIRDNAGLTSTCSATIILDTLAPSTPTLLSPLNGAVINSLIPTFSWRSSADSTSGVASYTLQIDTSSDFTSANLRTITGITSPSYTPTTPLTYATWYWRVKAIDRTGNEGSFSAYWAITIERVRVTATISTSTTNSSTVTSRISTSVFATQQFTNTTTTYSTITFRQTTTVIRYSGITSTTYTARTILYSTLTSLSTTTRISTEVSISVSTESPSTTTTTTTRTTTTTTEPTTTDDGDRIQYQRIATATRTFTSTTTSGDTVYVKITIKYTFIEEYLQRIFYTILNWVKEFTQIFQNIFVTATVKDTVTRVEPAPKLGETIGTLFSSNSSLGFMATGNIFDDSSMGFMFGHRNPPKVMFPKTDAARVNQTTKAPTWSDYTHLVMVGGRAANPTLAYYEDSGKATLKFSTNATHYLIMKGTTVAYAIVPSSITSTNDYFVMEVIPDGTHKVISLWGIGAPGTYAAGVYFDLQYTNLASLTAGWYVVRWQGTGTPLPSDTFTAVASGS